MPYQDGRESLTSGVKVSVALAIGNEDANLVLDILNTRTEGEVTETAAAAVNA